MTQKAVARIDFPRLSLADANKCANSLLSALRESDPSISVSRERTNPETQDGGATLAIILGSAAITQIARGIAAWLARNSGTSIEIATPLGGKVTIRHASGHDTAAVVEAALRNES